MNPASVSYDLHRQGISAADGDTSPVTTLDHTLCLESQVLVKVSGTNVSATIVMELECEPNGTGYYRSQSYTVSRSQALLIRHGGAHVRVRVIALTGTGPSLDIYLKRV